VATVLRRPRRWCEINKAGREHRHNRLNCLPQVEREKGFVASRGEARQALRAPATLDLEG